MFSKSHKAEIDSQRRIAYYLNWGSFLFMTIESGK